MILRRLLRRNNFIRGDYIVTLDDVGLSSCPHGYCFKQRMAHTYLRPELDATGSTSNGWHHYSYTPASGKKPNWRFATAEERAEYNRWGKPFKVDTV